MPMLAYPVRYDGSALMLELIPPMGSVLVSWLLLFLLFSGLGIAAISIIGKPLASNWLWLDSFWLGWALALGLMQVWHIVLPVNDTLLLLLALCASLLLARRQRSLRESLRRLARNKSFLLVFAGLALWMSNRALGAPFAFDTGYRDIPIVMWIDAYPIVPGLGNLFSSYAFNHSVYLYDALLDTSIWSGRSYHIATSLLLLVFLAYALGAAFQVYRSRAAEELPWSRIFASLLVPYILFQTVGWTGITHFLTDTVVDLIGFLTLIYLLDFLQYWRPDSGKNDYLVFRLAIIILTGLTVKQSFAIYGLATAILAIAIWFRRGGWEASKRPIPTTVMPIVVVALALLLPWMARGVITSGYVAFPQSIGRFELDWTIPESEIARRQLNLATNTRIREGDPEIVLASWDWLRPWLRDFVSNVFPTLLPTVITAAALGACLWAAGRKPVIKPAPRLSWWAFAPMALLLVIWFFTAPEVKYVRYILWGMAALSLSKALLAWHGVAWRRRVAALFLVILLCLAYVVFLVIRREEYLVPPGANDGFHAYASPRYNEFQADDGLRINVPTGAYQCWRIPLPCSPLPPEGIAARVPGALRHGFHISPHAEAD